MIPRDHDAWRREMGEVSSLPADDPQRLEMQAEVSRLGAWAEAEWLALLQEGERWRLELARVDVPEGIEERLLRIPLDTRSARLSLLARVPRAAWISVAAAVLIAVGAFLLFAKPSPGADPLERIAALAVHDHRETHDLDVTAEDPAAVASGLRERIPFAVQFPDFGGAIRLAGGRRCTIDAHPVCFTTWRGGGARFTLLQFRRADFGLPERLAPTTVVPKESEAGAPPTAVLVWTEGEFSWALVTDDPQALARVRPKAK